MAEIVLVNPYITILERYGKDVGDIGGHQMPLGIFYLAAYLRRHGFSVEVVDAEARRLHHEEVAELLAASRPRVVGITATTVGYRNAGLLATLLRERLAGTPLVIGGPHLTAMPEQTMRTGLFDYGIVKEGEGPLLALCSFLLRGAGRLEEVPNLLFLRDGELRANPAGEVIARLDDIPVPARDLCPDLSVYKPPVGAYRRKPVASVITSRGCPYQCIFCDNNTFGRRVRSFSAEYVAEEIRTLVRDYRVREIAFLDDTFVLDKARLRKIFTLLRADGIRFPWTCMTRVNNLDRDILAFMKEHGCWQIRVGIESGNPGVLAFIRKGITLEQVRNVAGWCAGLGIRTTGFFMVGHQVDTRETIDETIRFALSLPLSDVVVTINTPIPGTPSYEMAREYGEYREDDWTSLNYWTPVFVPRGLTRELLLEKQAEFYRRFYRRPRVLLGQIGKIRDLRSLASFAKSSVLGYRFITGARRPGPAGKTGG
jgi:radical SAM superfamily enzyme YgiQ (UPF0313 family)